MTQFNHSANTWIAGTFPVVSKRPKRPPPGPGASPNAPIMVRPICFKSPKLARYKNTSPSCRLHPRLCYIFDETTWLAYIYPGYPLIRGPRYDHHHPCPPYQAAPRQEGTLTACPHNYVREYSPVLVRNNIFATGRAVWG